MNSSRYTVAPAMVLNWTSPYYHPVFFNSDRSHWVPATCTRQSNGIRLPSFNFGRLLPFNRRKHSEVTETYLATKNTDCMIGNVGRHFPVPAALEQYLDQAFGAKALAA